MKREALTTFPGGRSFSPTPRLAPLRLRAAALLALASCGGGDAAPPEGAAAAASRVEIGGLDTVETALERRRGKGVLLNLWAIWCPPCVAELPDLAAVAGEFAGQGGLVLTVNYDLMLPGKEAAEIVDRVREFLADERLAFDVVVYDAPDFDAINERFDLPGPIPATLAFDRAGNVVDREEGPADRARFAEMMRRALAPP